MEEKESKPMSSDARRKSSAVATKVLNASTKGLLVDKSTTKAIYTHNFHMHGRDYTFAKKSLCIFAEDSKFRNKIVSIVTMKSFENLILFLIVVSQQQLQRLFTVGLQIYHLFFNPTKRVPSFGFL